MKTEKRVAIVEELMKIQKHRVWNIKTRIMVENRLRALVMTRLGYTTSLSEAERKSMAKKADDLIKKIVDGEVQSDLEPIVLNTKNYTKAIQVAINGYEKRMTKIAQELPTAEWVEHIDRRGFGLLSLAIVAAEAGDLCNYANPGKLWKRLGCAPFTDDRITGKTLMGSTWKSKREGSLSSDQWEEFGYCPRRRSISYLFGENILKNNQDGPYRRRYDESKAKAAEDHPEWIKCSQCEGTGKNKKGSNCSNCKGTGIVMMRCHLHGMLLATKLLLKHLWVEWNRLEGTLQKDAWVEKKEKELVLS